MTAASESIGALGVPEGADVLTASGAVAVPVFADSEPLVVDGAGSVRDFGPADAPARPGRVANHAGATGGERFEDSPSALSRPPPKSGSGVTGSDPAGLRPLFVPLYNDPYRRFERGSKDWEIRAWKGRWNPDQVQPGREVVLSRGYGTQDRLRGYVGRVEFAFSLLELPEEALRGADLQDDPEHSVFFNAEEPVVAFQCLDLQRIPREVVA